MSGVPRCILYLLACHWPGSFHILIRSLAPDDGICCAPSITKMVSDMCEVAQSVVVLYKLVETKM